MTEWVTDITKKELINGKWVTVHFKANRPSPEAIKRCAETMVRIVRQCGERKNKEQDNNQGVGADRND
ncbi:hypothetical protein ACPUYX_08390 [Desulfosporosinus sp. SYSU MS00001]|uniref:hypothetical protein n=1 Tax=Desulfosporosinus sp. SYSU MS00001 TaxID=3416284 RepID=UPI003CE9BC5D